ncbi:FHA domain-containing protein [bacterium]|nr:FHA domain-containing protein [bacterium]
MNIKGFGANLFGLNRVESTARVAHTPQVSPVQALPSEQVGSLPSGFRLSAGDFNFEIPSGRMVKVGRLSESDLCLSQDNQVSREHAVIQAKDGRVMVCDRNSSNGTFINGHKLEPNKWYELKSGCKLEMGQTELKVHGPNNASQAASPSVASLAGQGLSSGLQAGAAAIGGPAGALMKIIDFRELVADPKKQIEKFGSLVPEKPNAYWQNNAEARLVMRDYLNKGDFSNVGAFKSMLQQAHSLAVEGSGGDNRYYKGRNGLVAGPDQLPAGEFHTGVMGGVRAEINQEVDALAKKYGDPYRNFSDRPAEPVKLAGISSQALPQNMPLMSPGQRHLYPAPEAFDQYFTQMQDRLKRLNSLPKDAPKEVVLKNVAEFYQYGANVRPFYNVNNSLFMNMTNELLNRHGLKPVYHGILDHAAQRLQPEAFNRYFADWAQGEGKIQ